MRIRLVHTLSLLLVAAVLLTIIAMGVVMAWNLKSGFADYLAARDEERLEQFASLVGEAAEQIGGIGTLAREKDMRSLLDEFARRQGIPQRRGRPPPEGGGRPSLGPDRAGPPPSASDEFGARILIVGLDGQVLLSRPSTTVAQMQRASTVIERPIRIKGETVAVVRMRPSTRPPEGVDARFLRTQYQGIALVSVVLLLLSLGGAWLVARHWAQRLQAIQDATARIARGEFEVRLAHQKRWHEKGDEIDDLLLDINRMAEELQRLESTRRRWLADISHELRTPLAVMRGEIEALVDGVRPLRQEAILSLQEEVLQLGKLVDDLHLLAISDLQVLSCNFETLDAVNLIQQTARHFEPRATAKNLNMRVELGVMQECAVSWDGARFRQLLDNLLENSIRYTDRPGEIVLALSKSGQFVVMDVKDSAPGVPDTDLPRLFEPLYRTDAARDRLRGGSGLGLAICQAIVQSHGGTLQARASDLGGLHIQVSLPVQAGASA